LSSEIKEKTKLEKEHQNKILQLEEKIKDSKEGFEKMKKIYENLENENESLKELLKEKNLFIEKLQNENNILKEQLKDAKLLITMLEYLKTNLESENLSYKNDLKIIIEELKEKSDQLNSVSVELINNKKIIDGY
jgi:TolA-binding protein